MKVVILAGGLGTRIGEETSLKPKPMIEIGGKPILWHIMKIYSHYGFNEFIICAGYKQQIIKEFFANYFIYKSDVTFDLSKEGEVTIHNKFSEPWKVSIIDTGLNTQTGGRVKRIREYIGNEPFMITYGDAVGDIDIGKLIEFHKKFGKLGTMSVYNFGQNKGVVKLTKDGVVHEFREKSDLDGNLINIGFMVLQPEIFDFIPNDLTVFEEEPLHSLVERNELNAYVHTGFWQCMDTQREKEKLEKLWNSENAPWKIWKD
jgi:glucose-1-phosphate cytidylyltransferase